MQLILSLFGSKKFIAMLSGLIILAGLKIFKVNLDPATVGEIVGIIAVYIGAQGIADNGKAAAQVEAIRNVSLNAAVGDITQEAKAATVDAIKSV